jgi:hypothetical protein
MTPYWQMKKLMVPDISPRVMHVVFMVWTEWTRIRVKALNLFMCSVFWAVFLFCSVKLLPVMIFEVFLAQNLYIQTTAMSPWIISLHAGGKWGRDKLGAEGLMNVGKGEITVKKHPKCLSESFLACKQGMVRRGQEAAPPLQPTIWTSMQVGYLTCDTLNKSVMVLKNLV